MKSLISLFILCSLIGLGQGISKNTMILSGSCAYSQFSDTNRANANAVILRARLGLGFTYMVKERMGLIIGYGTNAKRLDAPSRNVYKQRSLYVGTLHLFKVLPKVYLGLNPQASYTRLRFRTLSDSLLSVYDVYTTRTFAIGLNLRAYWFFHRRWALSLEQRLGTISYSHYTADTPAKLNRLSWSTDFELLPAFQLGQLTFTLNYLINNKAGKAEQAPVQP